MEDSEKYEVFFPYAMKKGLDMDSKNLSFVHYTSASNALRILRNREITLRRSSLMNDFSEIDHGEKCLVSAWNSNLGKGVSPDQPGRLAQILNCISPTLLPAVEQAFDGSRRERNADTYLLSLAEHDEAKEDRLGKLSMWRAYGGQTNVALVIDRSPLLRPAPGHAAFTSPVLYSYVQDFRDHFSQLVDSLETNFDRIKNLDRDELWGYLVGALNVAAISTKHPGFAEENEWRVIYAPWLNSSESVESQIVEIGGLPQRVQKIRLYDQPEVGLTGIAPRDLLKRVIIGPTEHPYVLFDAFVEELSQAEVEDPDSKVIVSDIPIRR